VKILLDTHVLLWAAGRPKKLPKAARDLFTSPANSLFFSPANIWEIVIKSGLGREDFKADPVRLRKMLLLHGYSELPITSDHVLAVQTLPPLHKDPFDRILLAQARSEGMQLATVDSLLKQYGDSVLAL
jgi:PIN domain nuclease of toxin-antitoxin system